MPHCQQAVRLQPTLPAAHNNLGNVFRALERWTEARAAYHEALQQASRERFGPGEAIGLPTQARIDANLGFAFQLEDSR